MEDCPELVFTGRLESQVFEKEWKEKSTFRADRKNGWDLTPRYSSATAFNIDLRKATWISPSELLKLAVVVRAANMANKPSRITGFPESVSLRSIGIHNLASPKTSVD